MPLNLLNKCGIYEIQNNITMEIYIGSSKNIFQRFEKHLLQLRKNKHPNEKLQESWNKYGRENFSFNVVEECSENILLEKENNKIWENINNGFLLFNVAMRYDETQVFFQGDKKNNAKGF